MGMRIGQLLFKYKQVNMASLKHALFILPMAGLLSIYAEAQPRPLPQPKGFSLERLYSYPLINGRSPGGATMSPDGSKIVFGWNQTGDRRLDVWILDYPNGTPRQILQADRVPRLPVQDDTRTEEQRRDQDLYDGGIGNFQFSPDSKEILFNYRGQMWLMDTNGNNLRAPLGIRMSTGQARYSPDGRFISFVDGTNLYRLDRQSGELKLLTFLNRPNQSIGSYQWSPDSKQIVITWSDDSRRGRHVMMDFTRDRAEVVNIRRMWQGEGSVNSQIGLIAAEGGVITFVPNIPRYHWLKQIEWSPNSDQFAISWISEDFKKFNLSTVPIRTMRAASTYTETAPKAYINDWRPIAYTRDGSHIYLGTDIWEDKLTHRQVISVNILNRTAEQVYAPEDFSVVAMARPQDSDELILVTTSRNPLINEITILNPVSKETQVLIPVEEGMIAGGFDWGLPPMFSDDGKQVAAMVGNPKQNPEIFAVLPPLGRLTTSQRPEFKQIQWANYERVTFQSKDGQTIHATLITNPRLNKNVKHPAIVSGIYANSAKWNWGGWLDNYAAMELNMVVLNVDFRASYAHGGEFNSGYYKSMGIIDAEEAVAAKEYLASLGYVEPDRVGIWGWSYGGFLTCMTLFNHPGAFHAGVAVATVTDWRNYNEWYTRRRLGLEREDREVYRKTSPIHHSAGLQDNLLLVHGMLDDNVLFQDIVQLSQRLIENNKQFEQFYYPRDDHSIGRIESRPHVYTLILNWLYDKLTEPKPYVSGSN